MNNLFDGNDILRLPAEWEKHSAILVAWPHTDTDWAYMLQAVERCYTRIISSILPYEYVIVVAPDVEVPRQRLKGLDPSRIAFVEIPTDDTWTRDYGPITVLRGKKEEPYLLDFRFNGWGLKFAACHDNLVTRQLVDNELLRRDTYVNCLDMVLEGGSIESNGDGLILTTRRCLLSPNRNGAWDSDTIEQLLMQRLGAQKVLWLDHGTIAGDDTDSHIDTLARFTAPDTIAYVSAPADQSHPDYAELRAMEQELQALTDLEGRHFRLVPLPYAGPAVDTDGEPLPATYANFLITPRAVFVPTYGFDDTDDEALATISELFPQRDVVPVDCRALICQHGSLHCASMQLY